MLNKTFIDTNDELCEKNKIHSGCTAVVCYVTDEISVTLAKISVCDCRLTEVEAMNVFCTLQMSVMPELY